MRGTRLLIGLPWPASTVASSRQWFHWNPVAPTGMDGHSWDGSSLGAISVAGRLSQPRCWKIQALQERQHSSSLPPSVRFSEGGSDNFINCVQAGRMGEQERVKDAERRVW